MENTFLQNCFFLESYDGIYFCSPIEIVNGAQMISSCEPMRNATTCKPSSCCSSRIIIFILEEANNRCIWRMRETVTANTSFYCLLYTSPGTMDCVETSNV
uniref:Uncharacterized protein n=1 Tax=Mustela putorius furo TaxID=9669 RepID=M3YKK0_MUSPF